MSNFMRTGEPGAVGYELDHKENVCVEECADVLINVLHHIVQLLDVTTKIVEHVKNIDDDLTSIHAGLEEMRQR